MKYSTQYCIGHIKYDWIKEVFINQYNFHNSKVTLFTSFDRRLDISSEDMVAIFKVKPKA